ncbi:MAG: hypothetical protein C4537_03460 [Acholeplasma sp.]|jgi:uncharacterized protein YciI|nr:MAG: hypothetical protein C4537_03460 [Acholeplasma sp.]
MKTYAYLLKLNPRLYLDDAWTKEDEDQVNTHFLRLKKDVENGKVIHVGRTEDPKDDGFGFVVFYAENDLDAKTYAASDPAVLGGQMTASCFPYKIVF